MPVFIALLRAIGPVTHAKMSMAGLRAGCEAAGLENVATYINTGNLVFTTRKSAATVQRLIEGVVTGFGLGTNIAVIVRRPSDLRRIVDANPFPDAASSRPSELAACFLQTQPRSKAPLDDLDVPQTFAWVDPDLVVDYRSKMSLSKLSPGLLEKRLGVTMTCRNWTSLTKLLALAEAIKA